MSNKQKNLLKNLRKKERKQSGEEESNIPKNEEPSAKEKAKQKPLFQTMMTRKRRDSYIDPLEYFQKEHLIVKPTNMEEYMAEITKNAEEEIKKEEEEEKKPSGPVGMMMMGMPRMMGMPMPMGAKGAGFKINFEEMMKARQKIKKEPAANDNNQRSSSVKGRNVKKENSPSKEENKIEFIRNAPENAEENLYIKLVMARNKYNESNTAKANMVEKIAKQVEEIKQIKDLPEKTLKEVEDLQSKLKLPDRLMLDQDVLEINANNKFENIVQEPVSLEDVINSLNIGASN